MKAQLKNEIEQGGIDPGIVEEVKALDAAGINTCSSCQGGGYEHHWPDRHICFFANEEQVAKALRVALEHEWDARVEVQFRTPDMVDYDTAPFYCTMTFRQLHPDHPAFGWYDRNRHA